MYFIIRNAYVFIPRHTPHIHVGISYNEPLYYSIYKVNSLEKLSTISEILTFTCYSISSKTMNTLTLKTANGVGTCGIVGITIIQFQTTFIHICIRKNVHINIWLHI